MEGVGGGEMEPRRVFRGETRVVGLTVRTTNGAERDPARARIPALWERVLREGVRDQVPSAKPGFAAAYSEYESDDAGAYTLVVGAETEEGGAPPPGLGSVVLPGASCLVFEARGPMPQALIETWIAIGTRFREGDGERTYAGDLERHLGPDAVDIYIAVSRGPGGDS
jgi:predicted transcriptional regulator YdeE